MNENGMQKEKESEEALVDRDVNTEPVSEAASAPKKRTYTRKRATDDGSKATPEEKKKKISRKPPKDTDKEGPLPEEDQSTKPSEVEIKEKEEDISPEDLREKDAEKSTAPLPDSTLPVSEDEALKKEDDGDAKELPFNYEPIFHKPTGEEDDDVLENQLALPLFSITADGFITSYRTKDADDEAIEEPSSEDEEDEEKITPPDEIFAYRTQPQNEDDASEDEEDSPTADEDIPDSLDGDENNEDDTPPDGAQITLPELDIPTEPTKASSWEESDAKYDPKKPRGIDGRFDFVELFVFTLLAVMILTTFFFRHSIVDGSSMENTLHGGEHLIISDVFYTPKRGDIIVCEAEINGEMKPIVKRVIAVAGDHIRITELGQVFVNGELLSEDYVFIDGSNKKPPVDTYVYENEIFVMGDHRNVSADSREIGKISVDAVLGKVLFRFYPFDKFGTVK
ncbi:MAG: signal peptidase I [Clostridia bacterium]|nr:signal peptidase I [Clostridia bacterium]